jgi:undecaprenyl-diphosphatase
VSAGGRGAARARAGLSFGEAVALGALQGPTELLPVSSSGHTTLIPWLARRPYSHLDPQSRKAFEVALHAGAGLALALDMRAELLREMRQLDRRGALVIALSVAPPALCGYAFEHTIERRLGGPRSIAVGLFAGAIAMVLADARARGRCDEDAEPGRHREDAGPWDGLALGLAQAAALAPGVSRSGAALTAARARGFARADAVALSWHAALPVIWGASALKGWRLVRARAHGSTQPGGARRMLLAGATSAFASTLASAHVLRRPALSASSPRPWALYRCALAVVAMRRLWHERAQ